MRILVALLLAVSALLVLTNLGHVAFWDDEAHVALLGRSIVATHHNTAWDGRNLIPGQDAAWIDENLGYTFPQLDNYLAAVAIGLLGDSTWAARLPFALCGIGALILFWRILLLEFPGNPALQLYSLASACLSVPLLLYFRNCRYYGLSVLLTMGILLCYRRFLNSRRSLDAAAMGVMAGLLALTSILNCACLVGGLVLRHLLFHPRDLTKGDWLKVALALFIGAGFALPYVATCVLPMMARAQEIAQVTHTPPNPAFFKFFTEMIRRNLVGITSINAIPWSLGICLLAFLAYPREQARVRRTSLELLTLIAGFVLVLSAITPQNVVTSSIADLRYLTPMLPLMSALMGVVFWWINLRSALVACTVLLVFINTNLLGLTPDSPRLRYLLPEFCHEILSPYPTSCSETCAFLRANAQQDETLWFYPDWMGKPLMYYLGDKLKLRGILDRNTFLPKPAAAKIDPENFIENVFPNWVVSFGRNPEINSTVSAFCRPLPGTNMAYRYRLVKVVDIYWNQIQRPELSFHSFGPWQGFDKRADSVYIFQRSEKPLPQ